jgi:uncharacterized protein YggT (Ycf19 family)
MNIIKTKLKNILFSYLKHRKKYIYNVIIEDLIAAIKISLINLLPEIIILFSVILKFYKLFFFTKIILDQMSMFNSYTWPFSILRIIYKPYLKFWSRFLPKVKVGNSIIDISFIVGLEFLNKLSKLLFHLKIASLNYVKN